MTYFAHDRFFSILPVLQFFRLCLPYLFGVFSISTSEFESASCWKTRPLNHWTKVEGAREGRKRSVDNSKNRHREGGAGATSEARVGTRKWHIMRVNIAAFSKKNASVERGVVPTPTHADLHQKEHGFGIFSWRWARNSLFARSGP